MKKIVESHPGKVKLVLRYAPFHAGADVISKSLEASRLQGKYWETLELVYDKQREWADHHAPNPDAMWQYYPSVGLDVEKLRRDMATPDVEEVLRSDMGDVISLNVRKTPTFYVNGRPLQRFEVQALQAMVDDAVAKAYGG